MAVKQGYCSVPQGKFYIGAYGGTLQKALPTGGVITPQTSLIQNEYMGNTEEGKINYTLEEPQTANMDTRGAGIACYTNYVKTAMLDLSVVSNTAETSSLANFGGVREFAAGTVTDELHAVIKGTASAVSAASKNVFVPLTGSPT